MIAEICFKTILFIADENIDETYGINVQFEVSEDEDEEDTYGEVREDPEAEEDDGEDADEKQTLHANVGIINVKLKLN